MGGKPVAVDAGELGQADGERRSGCVPVPVRQGDYRAAHGAARSAHPISPGSGTLPRPGKGIPSICSCTPRFRWGCRCLSCIPPPMAHGVFVETGLVSGWVPTEDTAVTDAPFRSRYENRTYAVIVRDDVPLVDELGRYVTTGSLGTMLPLSGGSDPR